jgi:hypothetical protein
LIEEKALMFNSLSDAELGVAVVFWLILVGIVVAGGVWTYFDKKR